MNIQGRGGEQQLGLDSVDSCGAECLSNSRCVSFDFDFGRQSGACFFFYEEQFDLFPAPGITHYELDCGGEPLACISELRTPHDTTLTTFNSTIRELEWLWNKCTNINIHLVQF